MKISKSNRFNYTDNTSAGFTLIELLASISIMGIVSALVGTGINFMISSNQRLAAAQSRRVEVSQALEVISYDIRRAGNVNGTQNTTPATSIAAAITASVSSTAAGAGSLGSTWDSSYTPVLFLNISIVCNGTTIIPERVIYSTKVKGTNDGRVGPNILYRYGRIADKDDNIGCSDLPVNEPIVDNITTAATTPTCSLSTSAGANGLYTCISDTQVSIALFAKLNGSLIYGDNRTITSGTIASITQGSLVTNPPTNNECTVPALSAISSAPSALIARGLSYSAIPITGGSTVITQTPLADSLIPCSTGLVTYTY